MKRPHAGNFGPTVASWQWRWARDRWLSKGGTILRYDKLEHFLVYFFAGFLLFFKFTAAVVMASLFAIGLLWEIKDALMPYEKYGWWGGEGFSWKDLAANIIGMALALALHSRMSLD